MSDDAPGPGGETEFATPRLAAAAHAGERWRQRMRRLSPLFGLALLIAAIWIIYRELSAYSVSEILGMLGEAKPSAILVTIGLCIFSYLMLGMIEHLTLQMLQRNEPFLRVLRNAFVTYGTSNALGFAFATAPAARARIYRGVLGGREMTALSAITAASVALGAVSAGGLSLLFAAHDFPSWGFIGGEVWRVVGGLLLIPAILWVLVSAHPRNALDIMGIKIRTLGVSRALAQVGFTTADWLSTAGILYCFVPHSAEWNYVSFVAAFVSAGLIGAASGTPGGLGAFEATVLSLAPPSASVPAVVAALVAYRIVFTLLPLALASLLLAFDFLRTHPVRR